MAALSGGQTWGLSNANANKNNHEYANASNAAPAPNKSVVLVKLTDATLRTLEDYARLRQQSASSSSSSPSNSSWSSSSPPATCSSSPLEAASIRFPHGHQLGTISIPLGENGKRAEYSFSLSSLEDTAAQLQGGFECLSTREKGRLESIGSLQEKLQVKASVNDSYNTFEQKMHEANQEKEKRTTQFLERGPSRVARVTNVVSSGHASAAAAARRFHQSSQPRRKPAEDGSGSTSSSAIASRRHHHNYPHHHHHLQSVNPELMRRPLKERLIHLLAVRPYKKPELLARISRDGIHEKDKRNISLILKQVSIMKDNVYNLLRHLWNDVSEDWPFYTEQERQSFRRRKPQNLTPPCSDGSTSSSGRSPASTHPASPPHVTSVPSTSPPGKRGYGGLDGDGSSPVPKRRRVSNYVRPPDAKTPVHHGGGGDYLNGGSHSPNGRLQQHHHQARTSPLHRLNKGSPMRGSPGRVSPSNGHLQQHHHQRAVIQESNKSPWRAQQQQQQQQAPGCRQQVDSVIASSPDRGATTAAAAATASSATPSLGLGPVSESKRSGYQKDFARSFPPIRTQEQRLRYKEEFNRFYARYMELHSVLDRISKRFADLEDRLNKEEAGTEVWRYLKAKITKEYTAKKQSVNFAKDKEEFQYLHEKLAYIKQLVSDYDVDHPKKA